MREAPKQTTHRSPWLSPDVHYNRQWLRAPMSRHQLDNLPGAWWHYAQRSVPVEPSDNDFAVRTRHPEGRAVALLRRSTCGLQKSRKFHLLKF